MVSDERAARETTVAALRKFGRAVGGAEFLRREHFATDADYTKALEDALAKLIAESFAAFEALCATQKAPRGRKPKRRNAVLTKGSKANQRLAERALAFGGKRGIKGKRAALRAYLNSRGETFDPASHKTVLNYMSKPPKART
jgi:hypothetical protein